MATTSSIKTINVDKSKIVKPEGLQSGVATYVIDIFNAFKAARRPYEELWEECWYNYLGQYIPENTWRKETEGQGNRSKIFIKLTTLKCNTAHAKIVDVLFPGLDGVPFDIQLLDAYIYEMYGIDQKTANDLIHRWKNKIKDTIKKIRLQETISEATLEKCILGTAVLKGPIVDIRKYKSVQQRKIGGIPLKEYGADFNPYEFIDVEEVLPMIDHVPLWEYYVNPNANSPQESIGEIHFQRLLPAHFRRLQHQGGYNKERVLEAAQHATTSDESDMKYIQLGDNWMGESAPKDSKISVLEYWGLVPAAMLREEGAEIPKEIDGEESIESLVVLAADGVTIKAKMNPLGRRCFYVSPYKRRPNCIYGQGVAEAMRDSQKMINSSARLIIDNKALSGNGMVGINLDRINTRKTGNNKVYPGKVWYVKGAYAPKDAVSTIAFSDVTQGLRELMELFERFADEETGIPKYTHGEQDSFLNKTATGMSMLMGQSNLNIKTVLKGTDDDWIEPIIEALYEWLMAYDPENDVKLPLRIKATGTDSLIAKELKIEAYMKFMQITSNPQDAIFMDRIKLMKNIARLLETDDVMRSDQDIEKLMQEMSAQANTPKNLREVVDIDRFYPLLSRKEQMQILQELGIEPDPNYAAGENGKDIKDLELKAAVEDKKLQLEQGRIAGEIELKRQEIEIKSQIEREKMEIDSRLKEKEIQAKHQAEKEEKTREKEAGTKEKAQPMTINIQVDAKEGTAKKKVNIQRNKKGEIVSADIEEE